MMKKSKFVTLSQLASKATGGAYGTQATTPSLPPSTSTTSSSTPSLTPHTGGAMPATPGGLPKEPREQTQPKRATWADRVRDKLPPLEENEYEVLWERGVLGVIFLESEKDGIPYVSKATESCISPMVAPGDILKFVNVVRSKDHSFSDFFKILATMKKPVLLRFERPSPTAQRSGSPSGIEPLDQRSVSANDMNGARSTGKDATQALAAKVNRSNSLPPAESKLVQKPMMRGAFWRGSSARDPQPAPIAANSPVGKGTKYEEDDDSDTSDSPRGDDDDDDAEFHLLEVYWETGSLGLFFGEERGTGQPVVTRSTPGVNPTVHRKVQVNDVLLMANGVRSADYAFEAFFARLQQMNKPVKLVFRRKESAVDIAPARGRKASVAVEPGHETPNISQVPLQPPIVQSSRPTRLPPPIGRAEIEPERRPSAPSPGPQATQHYAAQLSHQQSPHNAYSARQEASPSSKPRSTSSGERIIEEERIPNSGPFQNVRGKSPSSRPDIVNLGSPKRKNRPPPPAPPAPPITNHAPSPRESVIASSNSLPSPQRQHSYMPSPTGRADVSRMSIRNPTEKNTRAPSPIYVLGDDFDAPVMNSHDHDDDDDDEDLVSSRSENRDDDEEELGEEVEEGVAVGVPVEPTDRRAGIEKDDAVKTASNNDAAEVAGAILAVVLDKAVTHVKAKNASSSQANARTDENVDFGLPVDDAGSGDAELSSDSEAENDRDTARSEPETEDTEQLDALEQEDPDIASDRDGNEEPKTRESLSSPSRPNNKAAMNASLAKYKKRPKNSRPVVKLPAISEDVSQTVPLVAPNAVNTSVQVRGRTKPKPSLVDTPDSSTYLVKWKEGRSVGLQLREVRLAKGTFPLVVDVCKEPCCESLKHVCVGDVIVEINSRNCSTMGVKKTVTFLKTSSKTMLLKFRRGPAFVNERVSASL